MYAYICAAAVLLLISILIMFRYFSAKKRRRVRSIIIIPVIPEDEAFERRVKSCYWEEMFSDPRMAKDILLVITEPCANAFAARRLAQEYPIVHSIHISSLSDYIIRNYGV